MYSSRYHNWVRPSARRLAERYWLRSGRSRSRTLGAWTCLICSALPRVMSGRRLLLQLRTWIISVIISSIPSRTSSRTTSMDMIKRDWDRGQTGSCRLEDRTLIIFNRFRITKTPTLPSIEQKTDLDITVWVRKPDFSLLGGAEPTQAKAALTQAKKDRRRTRKPWCSSSSRAARLKIRTFDTILRFPKIKAAFIVRTKRVMDSTRLPSRCQACWSCSPTRSQTTPRPTFLTSLWLTSKTKPTHQFWEGREGLKSLITASILTGKTEGK